MTQPSFSPVPSADRVRPSFRLKTPEDWRAARVADLRGPVRLHGGMFGAPGSDQGYALKLGEDLFTGRLELQPGERSEDVIDGGSMVAIARAALFGRAPVAPDLEMAFTLFGYLGGASPDLIKWRLPLFQSVSHHYEEQRRLVAVVPESTLKMTAAAVREKLSDWRELLSVNI